MRLDLKELTFTEDRASYKRMCKLNNHDFTLCVCVCYSPLWICFLTLHMPKVYLCLELEVHP